MNEQAPNPVEANGFAAIEQRQYANGAQHLYGIDAAGKKTHIGWDAVAEHYGVKLGQPLAEEQPVPEQPTPAEQTPPVAVPEPQKHVETSGGRTRTWVTRAAGPAKHYEEAPKGPGKHRNWSAQPDAGEAVAEPHHRLIMPEDIKRIRAEWAAEGWDHTKYLTGLVDEQKAAILVNHPEMGEVIDGSDGPLEAARMRAFLGRIIYQKLTDEGVDLSPLVSYEPGSYKPAAPAKREPEAAPVVVTAPETNVSEPVAADEDNEAQPAPEVIDAPEPVAETHDDEATPENPYVDPALLDSIMTGRHRKDGIFTRLRNHFRKGKTNTILAVSGAGRDSLEQKNPEELHKRNDRVAAIFVAVGTVALLAAAYKFGGHDSHSTITELLPKPKTGHTGHHGYNVLAGHTVAPKSQHVIGVKHIHDTASLHPGNNDWTVSEHELGSHASLAQVNHVDHTIEHMNHQTSESAKHLAVGTKLKLPVKLIASIRKSLRR